MNEIDQADFDAAQEFVARFANSNRGVLLAYVGADGEIKSMANGVNLHLTYMVKVLELKINASIVAGDRPIVDDRTRQ